MATDQGDPLMQMGRLEFRIVNSELVADFVGRGFGDGAGSPGHGWGGVSVWRCIGGCW